MSASSSNTLVIKIGDHVDKNLSLRTYANDFFNDIESFDQNDLAVDFDGVISVSRSFVQEFLSLAETSHKHITIINQSEEVQTIFRAVRFPRKKARIF